MNAQDRTRFHELLYARGSFIEAHDYAVILRTEELRPDLVTALITSMAVAYYRPFTWTDAPNAMKRPQMAAAVAEKLDAEKHRDLRELRHKISAHKDLSIGSVNIPVVRVHEDGRVDIHVLRAVEIAKDECARVEALCLGLVKECEAEIASLLKSNNEPPPSPGDYTVSHNDGHWLLPLTAESLRRTNL